MDSGKRSTVFPSQNQCAAPEPGPLNGGQGGNLTVASLGERADCYGASRAGSLVPAIRRNIIYLGLCNGKAAICVMHLPFEGGAGIVLRPIQNAV